jgi:hypothetical protein
MKFRALRQAQGPQVQGPQAQGPQAQGPQAQKWVLSPPGARL